MRIFLDIQIDSERETMQQIKKRNIKIDGM